MPITRIAAGVLKTPEFAHLQQTRAGDLLRMHLRDDNLRCYAAINDAGTPLAYAVCSFVEGTSSLLCSYFEDFVPGTVNRDFWHQLLDYTGFEILRIPAPSEAVGNIIQGHGFKLVEELWEGDVRPYRDFPVSKNIHSVSGEAFYKLTKKEVETLHELITQSTYDEVLSDVLERRLSQLIPNGMDEVLGRTGDYHYEVFVLREPGLMNKIIGFAYCHKLEPGYIAVGGLGVDRDFRNQRNGRKLLAAVLKHAAALSDKIYATVLAKNESSLHLFANVLKFKQRMKVYGMSRYDLEPPVKGTVSGGGKKAALERYKQARDLLQDSE